MNVEQDTPILIFGIVNHYQDERRQTQLRQEEDMIRDLIQKYPSSAALKTEIANPEKSIFLGDLLRKHQFDPNVTVLHLAGFSAGSYIHVQGGLGEDRYAPAEFAKLISKLPNLQLVLLNGCATAELVHHLLLLGIPAVWATAVQAGRKRVIELTFHLYQELLKGKELQDVFTRIAGEFKGRVSIQPIRYDLDNDRLSMQDGKPLADHPQLPWGLYTLAHYNREHEWAMVPPPPPVPAKVESAPGRWKQTARQIGSGIMVTALTGLLIFLFVNSPQVSRWLPWKQVACDFAPGPTYNILQMPFYYGDDCSYVDRFYAASVFRRLQNLGENYQVVQFEEGDCPVALSEMQDLVTQCEADLILWGSYTREPGADTVSMRFHYLYSGPNDLNQGHMNLPMPERLFLPEHDYLMSAVEDVVFWARGMGHFERENYITAAEFFEQVQVRDDDSYLMVDVRLAQCYTRMSDYDKALIHYDHLLEIDPEHYTAYNERGTLNVRRREYEEALQDFDTAIRINPEYADAFYNRSVLHLRLQQNEAARFDAEQVIELRPDDAKAYGILAEVYAEKRDKERLMSTVELALQKGLNPETFINRLPGIRAFQDDPDFKALLDQYQ